MVEAVNNQQFSIINYTNKNGEKISATKQGQTVTLINEKNETKQIQLNDFIKNELPNAKDIKLENSPAQDTIEISTTQPINQKLETPSQKSNKNKDDKKLDITA